MTQPTNSIDSKCNCNNLCHCGDDETGHFIGVQDCTADSIDRELDVHGNPMKTTVSGILNDLLWKDITFEQAEQALVSRKEIEEALKDETYDDLVLEDNKMHQAIWEGRNIRNKFRAELQAKLLPPTKGDNDE